MELQGLVSILELFLFWLLVVLVVFAVMFIGGLLVAVVSLPALAVLPTVRRTFVAAVERTTDVRPASITDWRFVGAYLLFVYAYGFTLLLGPAMLAEYLTTYGWLVPHGWLVPYGRVNWILAVAVVAFLGGGLLLVVRPAVTRRRLRAVGEWTTFLVFVSGLVLVAAVAVPYLLFFVVQPLLG